MHQDLMPSTHYAEQRSAPRSIPGSIPELRAALLGEVVAPDDPDYESARLVVNATVDRRPALIVRPADAADVSLAVSFARRERARARDPRRRAQLRRSRHVRRRLGIGHVQYARAARRPSVRDRVGPGRAHRRQVHRRNGAARPHDRIRGHRIGRDRRADPRRRHRLACPQARPDDRRSARRGARDRGRGTPPGRFRAAPGPVLGAPRRRRELRESSHVCSTGSTRSTRSSLGC